MFTLACLVTGDGAEFIVQWARAFGGPQKDSSIRAAVGPDGYVTVATRVPTHLGPVPQVVRSKNWESKNRLHLIRYNSVGREQWNIRCEGDGTVHASGIAAGRQHVYVSIWYTGSVKLRGRTLPPAKPKRNDLTVGSVLACISVDGNLLWVKDEVGGLVAVDANEHCLLLQNGSADVFALPHRFSGCSQLTKFAPSGKPQWSVELVRGTGFVKARGLSVDEDDNAAAFNWVSGEVVATGRIVSSPASHGLVGTWISAAGKTTGTRFWQAPAQLNREGMSITDAVSDRQGGVFFTGYERQYDSESETDTAADSVDGRRVVTMHGFVGHWDATGGLRWLHLAEGAVSRFRGLALGGQNQLLVTGMAGGAGIALGGAYLRTYAEREASIETQESYLAELSFDGTVKGMKRYRATGKASGYDIVANDRGYVYLVGGFGPNFDVDNEGSFLPRRRRHSSMTTEAGRLYGARPVLPNDFVGNSGLPIRHTSANASAYLLSLHRK